MKTKRHYFYLSVSITNTILFVTSFILFTTGFIVSLIKGIAQGVIVSGTLSIFSIIAGAFYLAFDGWANWRADGETIRVSKAFRGTKEVIVAQIASIREGTMKTVYIGTIEMLECYEICSESMVIMIPKSQASDVLTNEIRKRNNI